MSDSPTTPSSASPAVVAQVPRPVGEAAAAPAAPGLQRRIVWGLAVVLAALSIAALVVALRGQQRVRGLEAELVRRQQASAEQAAEARLLAKQSEELSRESAAKTALLEARVAEVAVQRGQLEDLVQALTRSHDDNIVTDVDAALRVAIQHSAMTGSAQPLVAALQSADERLARANQPRLEAVRRAVARDLDRVKSESVADLGSLAVKLDEAARLADEAPLQVMDAARAADLGAAAAARAGGKPQPPDDSSFGWLPRLIGDWWRGVWAETRTLVRVTRIDRPGAMLLAPEQSFFLRENLKLKLLNARLALLGRQGETVQRDLQAALATIDRWYDRDGRKTVLLTDLLHTVAEQARQSGVPRPDDTLAALATAAAGR